MRVVAATAIAGLVMAALPTTVIEAKSPGMRHCYKGVCHRVRTLEETRGLIGKTQIITASHYNFPHLDRFNTGTFTSNGERFHAGRSDRVSSSELPDGTELVIRNPENGRTAHVRVNDFGPFRGNRRLDVTRRVAKDLGFTRKGVTELEVTVIAAPLPEDLVYRRNRPRLSARGYLGIVRDVEMPVLIGRKIAERGRAEPDAVAAALPATVVDVTSGGPELPAAAQASADQPAPPVDSGPNATATDAAQPDSPIPSVVIAAENQRGEPFAMTSTPAAEPPEFKAASDAPPSEAAEIPRLSASIPLEHLDDAPTSTVGSREAPASGDAEAAPAVIAASSAGPIAISAGNATPARPSLSLALLVLIMAMLTALITITATRRARLAQRRMVNGGQTSLPNEIETADREAQVLPTRSVAPSALNSEVTVEVSAHVSEIAAVPQPLAREDAQLPEPGDTVIAAGTTITADMTGRGRIIVAGTLAGHSHIGALIIVAGGRVYGEITSDVAHIDGEYHGALTAGRVHVGGTALVRGIIDAAELAVEEGARLEADIRNRRARWSQPPI